MSTRSKSVASTTPPRSTLPWLHTRGEFWEYRKGVSALNALESASSDDSAANGVDYAAIAKYIAGTGIEFTIIMGILFVLQGNVAPLLGAKWGKAAVFVLFGFLAVKSRTFSVLDARRPGLSEEEEEGEKARRKPDWLPPPKAFAVIWITIGLLRAISSTMVWGALDGQLVSAPIAAMVFHLSLGDTWNHINNVEKRLGVAVPVVFLVWLSVANVTWMYYQTLPTAGFVLLPSVVWIAVANLLVQATWRLNGEEPLYPLKIKKA